MFIIILFGCYSLFLVALGITVAMRRTKGSTVTFAGFLALPFVVMFFGWLSSPTKPSRSDIKGHYVIDRSKYPGANADWQHQTYSLDITEGQVIVHGRSHENGLEELDHLAARQRISLELHR